MEQRNVKVLVVDDELPLRQEMMQFDWQRCGAEWVGDAENGNKALQLCRELAPDIVMTDITMPRMSGLELFREIRRSFPWIKVIVLTCHSEFQYAQEALKLGAVDYLVKGTMLDEQVEEAIDKARRLIEKDEIERRWMHDRLRIQWSKLLGQWMRTGGAAAGQLHAQLSALQLPLTAPARLVFLYADALQDDLMLADMEIGSMLEKWEQQSGMAWVRMHVGRYLLVFREAAPADEREPAAEVNRFIQRLTSARENTRSYPLSGLRVHAVLQECAGDVEALTDILMSFHEWRHLGFYADGECWAAGELSPLAKLTDDILAPMDGKMKKVMMHREELIRFIQHDVAEWAVRFRIHPEELKKQMLKWKLEWDEAAPWAIGSERHVPDFSSIATLRDLLDELLYGLMKRDESERNRQRVEVRLALRLIHERLNQPLTLSAVSEEIGMRDHYFSLIFREEMGESFNEYVTRKRIEKAMHLLKTTTLKVYEVAAEVGIPNYRYFAILFRKWTGMTPKDVRKG